MNLYASTVGDQLPAAYSQGKPPIINIFNVVKLHRNDGFRLDSVQQMSAAGFRKTIWHSLQGVSPMLLTHSLHTMKLLRS